VTGSLSWQDSARCVQVGDPELWDGVRVNKSHYSGLDFSDAKRVCDGCPVSRICLETALAAGDTGCMRGGKTPDELTALLKDQIRARRKRRVVRRTRRELVAA
jgi:hypothetical protein